MQTLVQVMYMVASVLFIVGIKRLSAVRTARSANALSALGMLAVTAAMINVVGGYLVTDRMLKKFRRKD